MPYAINLSDQEIPSSFLKEWCCQEEQYRNNACLIIIHHLFKAKTSCLASNISQFSTTFATPFKVVKEQLTKSKFPLDLHTPCGTRNHVATAFPEVITDASPAPTLQDQLSPQQYTCAFQIIVFYAVHHMLLWKLHWWNKTTPYQKEYVQRIKTSSYKWKNI